MNITIIIPARYGSTRLPGKPLAMIAGKTMLSRVVDIAHAAIAKAPSGTTINLLVATDDARIQKHCNTLQVEAVMTSSDCPTGTDRALAAIQTANLKPDYIINLQGDTPLMPPEMITALLQAIASSPSDIAMFTPVTQMSYQALDILRENKKTTPFSGTTALLDQNNNALWFSKNIIPAIRNEAKLREREHLSPVYRHFGLYAYTYELLEKYASWAPSYYEELEGLEQLRALEHGYKIRCVPIPEMERPFMAGVDSPEDITRAETLIETYGELLESQA